MTSIVCFQISFERSTFTYNADQTKTEKLKMGKREG